MGINFYFVSCGSVLDFFANQDPSSENQCWVDSGELGFEFDSLRELIAAIYKDFGANSIFEASVAERVRILVGSILGGMESELVLAGKAKDY